MLTPETIEEITDVVSQRSEVTRKEILETWDLAEADLWELKKEYASRGWRFGWEGPGHERITLEPASGVTIDEDQGDEIRLISEWEQQAVERLTKLCGRSQLSRLCGNLPQVIRQVRKHKTGIDRVANKRELASALVIQHGTDLFCNSEIRSVLGAICRVKSPAKWSPGKATAVEFVEALGFPPELAGIPSKEKQPDFEYLEPRLNLRHLEPFQIEVKNKLARVLSVPGERAIMTLPTGAGKTRVAVESLREWLTRRHETHPQQDGGAVLWLAHTEELCEQAYSCFKQVWEASSHVCSLHLIRFWGTYTQQLSKHQFDYHHFLKHPSVLISTPQRMASMLEGNGNKLDPVVKDLKRAVGVLIVDEAQRAAAPSYRRVIESLETEHPISIVGLTATPFRMEYLTDDPEEGTRELRDIFRTLIEAHDTLGDTPRQRLEEMGVLAHPVCEDIETATTISLPAHLQVATCDESDQARVDKVLACKADRAQRRLAVLDRLLPIAENQQNSILYFGPSVNDAECMAYLLRSHGIAAAVISGQTRIPTRRRLVEEFKSGAIRVLCNCEVLTTGFDAPKVTHVVMARPTVSRVLYEQVLGRGLRGHAFGGTHSCVILDCVDNFTGQRPPLGYESFRRIWEQEVNQQKDMTVEVGLPTDESMLDRTEVAEALVEEALALH